MIIEDQLIEPLILSPKMSDNKIVLTGGCFDILHNAHIEFLVNAKKKGDFLVLLLESDENIKKLKGKNRPVNNFEKRAENLEALGFIDLIVKLSPKVSDSYYFNLTKLIAPDIIAITKNDPQISNKKEQAELSGGKVEVVMDRDENHSSTKLIEKK